MCAVHTAWRPSCVPSSCGTRLVSGAAAALRRQALEQTHYYEDRLFFFWEEVDLSYQLIELGWTIADGQAREVWVVSNDTGDAELAECMISKVRRWRFEVEGPLDVSWPFAFRVTE